MFPDAEIGRVLRGFTLDGEIWRWNETRPDKHEIVITIVTLLSLYEQHDKVEKKNNGGTRYEQV